MMKTFCVLLIIFVPINFIKGAASNALIPNSHSSINAFVSAKTSNWKKKTFRHKKKKGNKNTERKRLSQIELLIGLGVISLAILLAIGFSLKLSFLNLLFFTFFTLATATGYVLAKRNGANAKQTVPKIFFIIAIVLNFIASALILYFTGLF